MDKSVPVFVDVVLPLPVQGLFTYRVPTDLTDSVAIGKRVLVHFGKTKFYSAIIVKIHNQKPENYPVKDLLSIIDEQAIVCRQQLDFWQWIADYYLCSIGEVMAAALPSVFRLCSETKISIHPDFSGDISSLTPQELTIIEALEKHKDLDIKEATMLVGGGFSVNLIKNMVSKSLIIIVEELQERYKPKRETFVALSSTYANNLEALSPILAQLEEKKTTQKQADALLSFLSLSQRTAKNSVRKSDLLKNDAVTESILKSLFKKNILIKQDIVVSRFEKNESTDLVEDIKLSLAQQKALSAIESGFREKDALLFHGVTGSGKTEIYIKLIADCIAKGKQVLYLLPEIALTTQIINRLKKYFGQTIGVYHSHFNYMQRGEIWQSMLSENNPYQILLGARSSIYLPFTNLGLIIVDEEHDRSFKQFDPAPRYNARDAALVLAKLYGAKVLLGTATPSMESYFNCQKGKYAYVSLFERFGGVRLPEIELVNIKEQRQKGKMHSHYSETLLNRIGESLSNKKQVILFQNRRGYSVYFECAKCGYIPQCANCDVTLTYHKTDNMLRCHYCGSSQPVSLTCPQCKDKTMKMIGFGTEKIEEELAIYFPSASIARLDYDSTRNKNAYQQILSDFEQYKTDILIGTQMVTKGLDFDNVDLVGVLDADNQINYPDFRSFERAFQLLMQVSGRAGRKEKRGRVLIQTKNTEHELFAYLLSNDYADLFELLLEERKNYNYPPFSRMFKVSLMHKEQNVLDRAAADFATLLTDKLKIPFYGPEEAIIPRVKNKYIREVYIKLPLSAAAKEIKFDVQQAIATVKIMKGYSQLSFVVDVDTY